MEKTKETLRTMGLAWWNSLTSFQRSYFKDLHISNERSLSTLKGREIEEIYDKEVLEPKRQEEWQESQVNRRYSKPNQKQFKQFDESLFKAYIDKFSDEDKLKALEILIDNSSLSYSDKQNIKWRIK